MLNLFPLQFLSLIAYTLLRIVIGIVFLHQARKHGITFNTIAPQIHWPIIKNGKIILTLIIICECIIGGLFILGLFTQVAAIMSIGLGMKLLIWHKRFPNGSIPSPLSLILLLAISASLFITGAGILAFDLPI